MAKTIVIPAEGTTLTLNGYAFQDLADGDIIALSFPNDKTSHTLGTNETATIKNRLAGDVGEITVNCMKYGNDDIFLNPFAETGIENGTLTGTLQRNYTKDESDFVESYSLSAGAVIKKPDNTISTQDGEELLPYTIRFAYVKRVI